MGTMDALLIALLALTGVTGLVDPVSFLEPGLSVARSSASLVSFLVGAAAGGLLGITMAGRGRRRWLLTVAVSEAALLFLTAFVSIGSDVESASLPASTR